MNVEYLNIVQGIDLPVDDLVLFLREPPLEGVDLGLHVPALLGLHDQPVARGLPLPFLPRLLRHLGVEVHFTLLCFCTLVCFDFAKSKS